MSSINQLFTEKYRPKKLDSLILPDRVMKKFQNGVQQNMLFAGSPGTGKTSTAKALVNQWDLPYLYINASTDTSVDVIRTRITDFCSTMSILDDRDKFKVVILDEADYISADSVQPALRGFIEEFSANCRFIFTCNYKNRIIPPLHSRTTVIDFSIKPKDKPVLAQQMLSRCKHICELENIKADERVLAELIMKFFPDFRRCLNEIQRYGVSGEIDSGLLSTLSEEKLTPLINMIKDKNWSGMRKWVGENSDNDFNTLYRKVFNSLEVKLEPSSIPAAVLIIADYQYKSAFAMDSEINFTACLTEIMSECKFKNG